MKIALKWTLGILAGLILIAAIAAIGYLAINRWIEPNWTMQLRTAFLEERGRMMPWREMPRRDSPRFFIPRLLIPDRPERGLAIFRPGGFSILRTIVGWVLNLAVLALALLGVVYLARNLTRPAQPAVAVAPAAPPTPPEAQATGQACPNCAQPVQGDWKHCPFCGATLEA